MKRTPASLRSDPGRNQRNRGPQWNEITGRIERNTKLRMWALSYAGKWARSRHLNAPILVTNGAYAFCRNPIYLGDFLIELGSVVLSEAFVFIPLFLGLFTFFYRKIVSEEEAFLDERFGVAYRHYWLTVPRWVPKLSGLAVAFSFGKQFPIKEIRTAAALVFGAFFFEGMKSPQHHDWVVGLLQNVFQNL